MDQVMTIDLWSDVVCPYCCIGEAQLERALRDFEHVGSVVLAYHAFELHPNAPASYETTLDELVARKYELPVERARELHQRLEAEAGTLGLEWRLDLARPGNTFDAHRLIALASTQGRGAAAVRRLFHAYFTDGATVSDRGVLTSIADEVGVTGVAAMLAADDYADDVRTDEAAAVELGFSGVPAIVIDRRFVVLGAQGAPVMLSTLRRAWERRQVA